MEVLGGEQLRDTNQTYTVGEYRSRVKRYISMYILNVRKKVLGVIISFEVTTHQPPILFLPVDGILVDCCLCFAHRWIGMAPSYKEMSLQQ